MPSKLLLAILLLIATFTSTTNSQSHSDDESSETIPDITLESSRCQPMQIPFCAKVDYNRTLLPNILGHQTQSEIESDINIWYPLVELGCSPDLRMFLCSVYAPMCFDHDNDSELHLMPCRSLCETVRNNCSTHLKKLHFEWPRDLQCDRFLDGRVAGTLCVGNDTTHPTIEHDSHVPRDLGFVCPKNFEVNSYSLHLNGKTYNNCAMPCEDVYLDKANTRTVRSATGALAIVCLLTTIFTCLTYLINTKRFQYPARPIIIIAFCQMVVATCYLIGFLTSNMIACNDPTDPPMHLPNMKMIRTTTMGNKKGSCTLLFMALYFFQLSTMFWWLMMTISWYMIAKLKWAPESVSNVSRYFHLFSWAMPALLTIYLSVLGDIEGDPLTGTCHVSTSNMESVTTFIIVPTTACLITGCIFLALGFKSIWDSREILKRQFDGKQTDEHYKLVIRIGLYSFLFIIFSSLFIYSHHIEQTSQAVWKLAWLSNICKNRDYSIPCPVKDFSHQRPGSSTFLIKYVASMAVGILSALFMFSKKTMAAYRRLATSYKIRF